MSELMYTNKSQVSRRCQDIVARHENGVEITGYEFDELIQLLHWHPEAEEKFGPGIEAIWVDLNRYGTRSFYLRRTDGTKDDFSWVTCVRHCMPSMLNRIPGEMT